MKIRCVECMWEGKKEDLLCRIDIDERSSLYQDVFAGSDMHDCCPNCLTDMYLLDLPDP